MSIGLQQLGRVGKDEIALARHVNAWALGIVDRDAVSEVPRMKNSVGVNVIPKDLLQLQTVHRTVGDTLEGLVGRCKNCDVGSSVEKLPHAGPC